MDKELLYKQINWDEFKDYPSRHELCDFSKSELNTINPNLVYDRGIKSVFLFEYQVCITKYYDDWFLVWYFGNYYNTYDKFYICDEISGVMELLNSDEIIKTYE